MVIIRSVLDYSKICYEEPLILKESNKLYIRALKLVLGLPQNRNGEKLLLILIIPI